MPDICINQQYLNQWIKVTALIKDHQMNISDNYKIGNGVLEIANLLLKKKNQRRED